MIKHMNACKIGNKLNKVLESGEYQVEPKLQGNRAFLSLHPGERPTIVSRGGKDRSDRCHNIIYNIHTPTEYLLFDGELYSARLTDAEISGILHSNDMQLPSHVKFHAFDLLRLGKNELFNTPLYIRRGLLDKELLKLNTYVSIIERVPYFCDQPPHEVRNYFENTIELGGEGIMLKHRDGLYMPDKRPQNNWFKWKRQATFDVFITGYTDAEYGKGGKFYGQIGAVKFGVFEGTRIVELGQCSGMSDTIRKELTDNKQKYLGTVIEVECQRVLASGALSEPRWKMIRHDKDPKECTLDMIRN